MKIKDQYIVLTGASSGIGFDLLKLLLQEGAYVLAISRTMESLEFDHERLTKLNADLTNKEAIDHVFDKALSIFPSIDAFIANAGFAYYERLLEASIDHINQIFDINTLMPIYAAVKMKSLQKDKPFNYMATLSAVSFVSLPGYALYSGTKSALRGFLEGYQLEMAKDQVISLVYPVATKTNFFEVANQSHKPWPVQESMVVAKTMLKGLKKDKKAIYPSKLFKYSYKLIPWFYSFYKRRELKKFNTLK